MSAAAAAVAAAAVAAEAGPAMRNVYASRSLETTITKASAAQQQHVPETRVMFMSTVNAKQNTQELSYLHVPASVHVHVRRY